MQRYGPWVVLCNSITQFEGKGLSSLYMTISFRATIYFCLITFYNAILNILLFSLTLSTKGLFVRMISQKSNTILIKFTERAHSWHKIITVLVMILINNFCVIF